MPSEKFIYQLTILETHLDTFGHVNNAAYLQILEQARWEFITQRGYGLADIQRLQQGPVVLDVRIKFRRELKLRETVRIESQVQDSTSKVGSVQQTIYSQNGESCCEAEFTVGFFDLKTRKLIKPTEKWLYAVGLATSPGEGEGSGSTWDSAQC